jgi:hypothetical protein
MGSGATWTSLGRNLLAIALGLAIGTATQVALSPAKPGQEAGPEAGPAAGPAPGAAAEAPPGAPPVPEPPGPSALERFKAGLTSKAFWRKLVLAVLALAIGEGLGAVTPKYLHSAPCCCSTTALEPP